MIGRGKSALVKSLLLRSVLHGTKGIVFDVKGEYAALADALGCTPLRLAPGGTVRLNPLDPRSSPREQAELVEALAATALARPLRSGGADRPRTRPVGGTNRQRRSHAPAGGRRSALAHGADGGGHPHQPASDGDVLPGGGPRAAPPVRRRAGRHVRRPHHRRGRLRRPPRRRRPQRRVPLPRPAGGHDLCGRLAPGRPRCRRRAAHGGDGRVVAHVLPPAHRRLDAAVLQAVAGVGNDERAGHAPPVRPGLGRRRRLAPGPPGRRAFWPTPRPG